MFPGQQEILAKEVGLQGLECGELFLDCGTGQRIAPREIAP
jgi:hypothetical protein